MRSQTMHLTLRALGMAVAAFAVATTIPDLATPRRRRAGASVEVLQVRCRSRESRRLHGSAGLLAASVLADSAIEHYRGAYENPGMYAPLIASLSTLIVAFRASLGGGATASAARTRTYRAAFVVGLAGFAFHVRNIAKRPGGFSWLNLFYGAPIAAPAALSAAAIAGLAGDDVTGRSKSLSRWFGDRLGATLTVFTSIALLATSGEAALLHFRGAFHNPVMWTPVALPPIAALLVARATVRVDAARLAAARAWLRATAFVGVAGVAMHAYGVSRAMGGFRNWSQNVIDGPPLPAPPSFMALALAGLAALSLLERKQEVRRVA
ncbi:MAG TPA: hypothetical protein VLI21_09620 [Casimicrobiaceae bacterium]|nr:hypothetical protein [Casimicrobiaceae bacterium]